MTATDMRVEPCPSGDDYIIVTTYFLVENTTLWRTIQVLIESDFHLSIGRETYYVGDMLPRSNVEIYVSMVIPADTVYVRHRFNSYRTSSGQPLARLLTFRLPLDLAE